MNHVKHFQSDSSTKANWHQTDFKENSRNSCEAFVVDYFDASYETPQSQMLFTEVNYNDKTGNVEIALKQMLHIDVHDRHYNREPV